MYDTEMDFKQVRTLVFSLKVYYGVFGYAVSHPCRPRPPHCEDSLTKTDNPPMNRNWIDKPCLN